MTTGTSGNSRKPVVTLLHVLFHAHPLNTCQPTHITPLVHLYGGTLSEADQKLLSIFFLFERNRKVSARALLGKWSGQLGSSSVGPLEAITSLDASVVFRTCLSFPNLRSVNIKPTSGGEKLYDPTFILSLVGSCLLDHVIMSGLQWVDLFRTNVVSLVVRALSSKNDQIRLTGKSILSGIMSAVQVRVTRGE